MTSTTMNGPSTAALELEELLDAQEALRAQIKALMARLEAMRVRVEVAEAAADEAADLRRQVDALTARLRQERAAQATASTPHDIVADKDLRESYEDRLADLTAERDQLVRAREELEARLAEAEGTYAEEMDDLKAERDVWIIIAEERERELMIERERQRELEELAEVSMSAEEHLRQVLQQTERELIEARRRRDELQAQLDSRDTTPAASPTSATQSVNSTPPTESPLSRELIDELMSFIRRATDPAPAVLKELRDVRRLLETSTSGQQHLEEMLDTRLPVTGTWEKLVTSMEELTTGQGHLKEILAARLSVASYRRPRPQETASVTDQLALPILPTSAAAEGEATTQGQPNEQAPYATLPAPIPSDNVPVTVFPATDDNAVAGDEVQDPEIVHTTDVAPAEDVPWQEQFARIEQAWLANQSVGDLHEGNHLRGIAARVRRIRPDLRDGDALLRELDVIHQRYGNNFSYCLLDGALHQLHRPILNPLLLTTKMRQLQRQRHRWHP